MGNPLRPTLRALTLLLSVLVPSAVSAQTTITVLHVGDSHSHLDAFGPKTADLEGTLGGIAKTATIVGGIRATEPNTLFLHSGDAFQGDLFFNVYFGVPELMILNQLGLDAMTVGNHEFDFGPGVLAMALSQVGEVPLISSNLDYSACAPDTCFDLPLRILPSRIKEVGGVSVGIFGLTVPDDRLTQPAPIIIQSDVFPIAAQTVAQLRESGAQVVIALSHLGMAYDQAIAANIPGIDFIVSGHDHYLTDQPIPIANPAGQTTLIVAAGEFYKNVGRLRFTVDGGQVRFQDFSVIPVDDTVPPEPNVQAVVDQLKDGIIQKYGDVYTTVLGTAEDDVTDTYDPTRAKRDTGIGNLVSDALRAHTGTDLGLTTSGLISEGLYAGPVVGADVFRAVSYGYDTDTGLDFKLATFRISGAELLKSLEYCLQAVGLTNAFDVQASGLRYEYDSRKPVGQRLLQRSVRIHGLPVVPGRLYSVTSNLAIVLLLPSLGIQVQDVQILPEVEYNAVRSYVTRLGTFSYESRGRIRDVAALGHRRLPCRVKTR